jgi:alpha-glucosidase
MEMNVNASKAKNLVPNGRGGVRRRVAAGASWALASVIGLAGALAMPAPAWGQPVGELVGWNSARFFPSAEAAAHKRPSLAFFRQPEQIGEFPEGFALVPQWSDDAGRRVATIAVPESASLYGLGRASGGLVREHRCYHTDEAAPWAMGVREDGTAFGILLDSTWGAEFTLSPGSVSIATADPAPVVYVFDLASPSDVVIELNARTGGFEMPPLWALGLNLPPAVRAAHPDLPADSVRVECNLMDAAGPCPPEGARPLPVVLQGRLTMKRDDAAAVGAGDERPVWLRAVDGEEAVADRLVPDFSDPGTRQWWGERFATFAERGAAGVVVEADWLKGVPSTAVAAGDPDLGGAGPLDKYRGVMGLLAARASWEGYGPDARDRRAVFIVPATALGSQRWTAHQVEVGPDGVSTAEVLIAAALNSAMSAQPLVGASGFPADGVSAQEWEVLTGAAGMLPLWTVGGLPPGDAEASAARLVRAIASVRHQLLPYSYTQVFNAFYQNQPLLSPLFFLNPGSADLRGDARAFLVGRDLLVAPKLGERTFRSEEAFPGLWLPLDLGEAHEHLPAVYMRRGSIVPLAGHGQTPADFELDPLILAIALDEAGEATGVLYEDDWDTYGLFRSETRRITYRARREGESVLVRLGGLDGGWGMPRRVVQVRLLEEGGERRGRGSERGTIRVDLAPEPD